MIKQSETIIVKRSQININPYNPKKHSDKQVSGQKKDIQKFGYLGGVTWNRRSGNLIDGHRRIKALDLLYKYDGTPETDYEVKVEAVDFTDREEKEQMTYMALGNTKADYALVAEYINEIEYDKIGIAEDDISAILALANKDAAVVIETIDSFITPTEEVEAQYDQNGDDDEPSYEEKKAHVKEMKALVKEKAIEAQRDGEAYIMLSFSTFDAKACLCEILGIDPENDKFAKGEDVLKLIK